MPVSPALARASFTARQDIAGGMPSRASTMAQEGPSATTSSLAPPSRRPLRALIIRPRICRVPWVKVPQVSVLTNTWADSSASSWPMPARVMAATQNFSRSAACILVAIRCSCGCGIPVPDSPVKKSIRAAPALATRPRLQSNFTNGMQNEAGRIRAAASAGSTAARAPFPCSQGGTAAACRRREQPKLEVDRGLKA